jgi:hypothetical protein
LEILSSDGRICLYIYTYLISLTQVIKVNRQFATGGVDTGINDSIGIGGKHATSVVDASGAT